MLQKLGLGLVCAVLVSACGGDDDSCPTPSDATTVAQLIGPAGGTVELTNGGKVEIPAGALDADTMITITEVANPKPLPLGLDAAGKAYAFKPHGTMFTEPVTITVPFEDDDVTEVRAMKLDDDNDDTWQTVVGADKTAGKLSIDTTTFSIYVAARPRRNSGVVVLPDGAIILPGVDASTNPDAAIHDAMIEPDGAIALDGGQDAAAEVDGGCSATDAGCPVGEITQLVAGYQHVCALYSLGAVYCWGGASTAAVGQGGGAGPGRPGRVQLFNGTDLADAISISANARGNHTCAARSNGSVVCWGDNSNGQCGSDAPVGEAQRAYQVPDVAGAVAVSAGSSHSCALLSDGGVLCWGLNSSGQLSSGSVTPAQSTAALPMVEINVATGGQQPVTDAVEVVAGMSHTCVVHSGRTRVSCGGSHAAGGGWTGNLGVAALAEGVYPAARDASLPTNTVVQSIHVGAGFYASHTCVRASPSRPICWGPNTYRQLAPTGGSVSAPTQLDAYYTAATAIALGSDFSCVAYVHSTLGPRVACQGSNGSGQLGDSTSGTVSDSVPDDVGTAMDRSTFLDGADVELMAAGGAFVCVKLVDSGVTCWGGNSSDVFGNADPMRTFADVNALVPGLP